MPDNNTTTIAAVEAEVATIGAVILDADQLDEISTFLKPSDFFIARNAWVYEAIENLRDRKEPIDYLTISNELERRGRLSEAGGIARIVELVTSTPSSQNGYAYARMVEQNAMRRRVLQAAERIAIIASNPDQPIESVIDPAAHITDIIAGFGEQSSGDLVNLYQNSSAGYEAAMQSARNRAAGLHPGIQTGLTQLDFALGGGMKKQKLIIVAARPGQGKSALLQKIANSAMLAGKRALIWTGEMSNAEYDLRLKCIYAGIDSNKVEAGLMDSAEWERYTHATEAISQFSGGIFDQPGITVHKLRSKALQMRSRGGLDLIILDYLGLMTGQGRDKNAELSEISGQLKSIAKEFDVPVLAAHQMNRGIETRGEESAPQLSDLRDSGSLEQDADVVMFLHCPPSKMSFAPRPVRLYIQKNRSGRLSNIELVFVPEFTRFAELAK